MALVDLELAALRDPGYQGARLEAQRCLVPGSPLAPAGQSRSNQGPNARDQPERMTMPKIPVSAEERRERRRLRSVRRYEKMLALIDKPGAERILPGYRSREGQFSGAAGYRPGPKGHRESFPGEALGGRVGKSTKTP
jgi:hypothetical protein